MLAVLFEVGVPVGGLLNQKLVFQEQVNKYLENLRENLLFGIYILEVFPHRAVCEKQAMWVLPLFF